MILRTMVRDALQTFEPGLLRRGYTGIGEVDERIRECRRTLRSNCIGTALYISREIGQDECVSPYEAQLKFLSRLDRLDHPIKGCIVAWHERITPVHLKDDNRRAFLDGLTAIEREQVLRDNFFTYTPHMGIVTSLDGIHITHRVKTHGVFKINQKERRVAQLARSYAWRLGVEPEAAYYLPRALRKDAGN
jgi:hypothetical protein